jgi:ankyrin repeat protein
MFVEHPKLVQWLIEKGANPSVESPSGDTPLSFAVTMSSVETIERLISANKTFGQDLGTGDLVHRAVRRCGEEQNLDILDLLIRAGAPVDDIIWDKHPTLEQFRRGGPLHEAVKYGYTDVASVLIANGADPHKQKMRYRRMDGDTPYEIATKNGDTAMLELMQRR